MNINKFAIGIFLILASNIVCKAQSDCVYDESRLTDSFLKTSKQIDFYKWDADKKEGTAILNDGSIPHRCHLPVVQGLQIWIPDGAS